MKPIPKIWILKSHEWNWISNEWNLISQPYILLLALLIYSYKYIQVALLCRVGRINCSKILKIYIEQFAYVFIAFWLGLEIIWSAYTKKKHLYINILMRLHTEKYIYKYIFILLNFTLFLYLSMQPPYKCFECSETYICFRTYSRKKLYFFLLEINWKITWIVEYFKSTFEFNMEKQELYS